MSDQPELLTKAQTAELLGRSERAVARHTAAGRLTATYQKRVGGGEVAYFRRDEVEELKRELEQPRQPSALTRRDAGTGHAVQPSDPATLEAIATAIATAVGPAVAVAVRDALMASERPAELPLSELSCKTLLTVDEASRLTGLSRELIERAITKNRLRARPDGPEDTPVVLRSAVTRFARERLRCRRK